jgi:hypothetical protein
MTQCDVYIGRLSEGDDPFGWGSDWRVGNIPSSLGGTLFPPSSGHGAYGAFSLLIRRAEAVPPLSGWAAIIARLKCREPVHRQSRSTSRPR